MDWIEVIVSVDAKDTETASAIANMVVPYGIYIEDYSDMETQAVEIAHIDLIDEELLKKDRNRVLIHIYFAKEENASEAISFLRERLSAEGIETLIEAVGVNDSEWAENWKKYFKPMEIGKRIAICPSWEEYDNREERSILRIDPGAAFGMMKNSRWIFLVISFVAIIGIIIYLIKFAPKNRLCQLSLAFILGGGIGNMIDRLALGYVVDFIDFRLINFAVFNVADSFVCVGAALLIVYVLFIDGKENKKSEVEKNG